MSREAKKQRGINPVGFLKTWSDSSYLGQTDSSYVGQEVKISDPVWKIVSLADNSNIAPPLAFIRGAWRPKADYLGCGGWGEAP